MTTTVKKESSTWENKSLKSVNWSFIVSIKGEVWKGAIDLKTLDDFQAMWEIELHFEMNHFEAFKRITKAA